MSSVYHLKHSPLVTVLGQHYYDHIISKGRARKSPLEMTFSLEYSGNSDIVLSTR